MKWTALVSLLLLCFGFALAARSVEMDNYQSPYSLALSYPLHELLAPDRQPPRADWREQSVTPYEFWYSQRTLRRDGSWGPLPRHYPAIPGLATLPVDWQRQRLLAVAQQFIGLPYQHHHIPAWDPPPNWPWKEVAYGRNSPGVDCSDFTSWIYNYGLGIKLKTGIRQQADTVQIPGPGGEGFLQLETINNDNGYQDLVKKLKTGDLLYIKNNGGTISHVIMWVGEYGKAPDGAPLIIDCTGSNHRDSNGTQIPIGVHLRPFLPDEWYYKSFDHAHRILVQQPG